jgi:hypothetical protein
VEPGSGHGGNCTGGAGVVVRPGRSVHRPSRSRFGARSIARCTSHGLGPDRGTLRPALQAQPSPVVELNRAVAVAMRDGPAAGLDLINGIFARRDLENYHLAHATRADLCRRLGQTAEARASYEQALSLTQREPERRFLKRRLSELPD